MKIIFGCSKNDTELKQQCEEFFGKENIEILRRDGALGIDEIALIISCADFTLSAASFIYTVLADYKKNQNDINKNYNDNRRVLITKDGDINIEGFSYDETMEIIKSIYGNIK